MKHPVPVDNKPRDEATIMSRLWTMVFVSEERFSIREYARLFYKNTSLQSRCKVSATLHRLRKRGWDTEVEYHGGPVLPITKLDKSHTL